MYNIGNVFPYLLMYVINDCSTDIDVIAMPEKQVVHIHQNSTLDPVFVCTAFGSGMLEVCFLSSVPSSVVWSRF